MLRVPVILNPASGPDQPTLKILNRAFNAAQQDWELFLTRKAGDAARLAEELYLAGEKLIAVCGGDGTVKEVASALAGRAVNLAILPGGTGNALARDLGIPIDLAAAVALVCGPHKIRPVDMGRLGERLFILRVSLGLETEILRSAGRDLKDQLGLLAYPLSAWQSVARVPFTHYTLTIDGQTMTIVGVQCTVANSAQMGVGGLNLAQGANVSDGLLDVIVLTHVAWDSLAAIAASNLLGQDTGVEVQHWSGREIRIEAEPPQDVAIGGEIVAQTPVTISVWPSALNLVVPK